MKFSWTSLRISIAGAKLSHLSQKDRIWDHGTMIEIVKIIFNHVQKARTDRCAESLRKYATISCFEKLQTQFDGADGRQPAGSHDRTEKQNKHWQHDHHIISKLAVISVQPGKNNNPDMFTALIEGYIKNPHSDYDESKIKFSEHWSFVRQGEWWVLDKIDERKSIFIINKLLYEKKLFIVNWFLLVDRV